MEAKKIYKRLFTLYNKTHAYHIQTVKMAGAATLHTTLGEAYETLEDLFDRVGEDLIVKRGDRLPTMSESADDSVEDTDSTATAEEIASEIYADYESLSEMIARYIVAETDVFYQNIFIEIRDGVSKLCADMARERCDEDEEYAEKEPSETVRRPKIGT
jgi:DNA-binding ferritin-like protein